MQKSEGMLEELPGRIPKIFYFQTAGRAQPIRLTFVVGGIKFVDVRMAREKVEDLKRRDVLPFGTLPVMELGDQVFSDSNAILRLAGRMTGMYPEKVVPAVRCDEILGVKEDIVYACHPWIYAKPEDKPAVRNELVVTTVPRYMYCLERRLERNPKSPYFVGDELTVADMAIFGTMSWILTGLEYVQALERYPRLQHLMNKVGSMPAVREYLETGKGAETQNIEKDQATPEICSEVQLCREIQGQFMDHEPSKGTKADTDRYKAQYGATVHLYDETFGEPDATIWCPEEQRCNVDKRYVFVTYKDRKALGDIKAIVKDTGKDDDAPKVQDFKLARFGCC